MKHGKLISREEREVCEGKNLLRVPSRSSRDTNLKIRVKAFSKIFPIVPARNQREFFRPHQSPAQASGRKFSPSRQMRRRQQSRQSFRIQRRGRRASEWLCDTNRNTA